jgi:hypothetical protein
MGIKLWSVRNMTDNDMLRRLCGYKMGIDKRMEKMAQQRAL